MVTDILPLEGRLRIFLTQLQAERGILERIVYKNKNQHRRSSYFQYLLKVRRDLKLLHSMQMEELLESCFHVITGRKAKQKVHLLESLKRRKTETGNHNFKERLQGAARLLSQMVEPILKTATEISTLLARSFFMGFSLTILALLARIRVLVQQMLLDVVSVFNEVSSLSQKKQSVKITQNGVEVFREYYPTMEEFITLECAWEIDKFVLVEKTSKSDVRHQDGSPKGGESFGHSVQYLSIEAFLGDDESDPKKPDADSAAKESMNHMEENGGESLATAQGSEPKDGAVAAEAASPDLACAGGSSSCSSLSSLRTRNGSKDKVAFISVKKPAPLDQSSASKASLL